MSSHTANSTLCQMVLCRPNQPTFHAYKKHTCIFKSTEVQVSEICIANHITDTNIFNH